MNLLMQGPTALIWQDTIKEAKDRCSIQLNGELEAYLVSLLIRYANQPEIAQRVFASAFLDALQAQPQQRQLNLQALGDQCLLYAGFFPRAAEKRNVKLSYFVDLGRAAYTHISAQSDDLYWSLALQFVALMDVLQSVRQYSDMLPLEAYEQWQSLGSQRAFQLLCQQVQGLPIKNR